MSALSCCTFTGVRVLCELFFFLYRLHRVNILRARLRFFFVIVYPSPLRTFPSVIHHRFRIISEPEFDGGDIPEEQEEERRRQGPSLQGPLPLQLQTLLGFRVVNEPLSGSLHIDVWHSTPCYWSTRSSTDL